MPKRGRSYQETGPVCIWDRPSEQKRPSVCVNSKESLKYPLDPCLIRAGVFDLAGLPIRY